MCAQSQMTPGMTIALDGKIFRVESCVKVTVTKGSPFIKAKLKNLKTDEILEKNFKVGQEVENVALQEKRLEFLYLEAASYLFLDIDHLDQLPIPADVIGDKVHFLKEGVEIKALFYGDTVFSIELPQFLELMVVRTDAEAQEHGLNNPTKTALLETSARISVPSFIEAGDIIKIDTTTLEYVQRV